MAKEIYIDNLGNEIPVCGVPLSAEDLPIQAGSSTSTEEAITYHVGDEVTLTNGVFIGIVGNSSKQLTFWIPVNKVIGSDITGATLTGNMTIYSTNLSEGINNDAATGSWTITIRDSGISCVFALVNALSTTNRTAVAVRFSASGDKLTFT